MNIGSVQSQQSLGYEAIREIKVPLKQAIETTQKDGLDEVFFKADGKDYVVYGRGMDLSNLEKGMPISFQNTIATITHIDNESNSAGEGAKTALKSMTGKVASCAGAAIGGFSAYTVSGMLSAGNFSFVKNAGFIAFGAVAVGAVAAGVTATVGAISGAAKTANYKAIDSISR